MIGLPMLALLALSGPHLSTDALPARRERPPIRDGRGYPSDRRPEQTRNPTPAEVRANEKRARKNARRLTHKET